MSDEEPRPVVADRASVGILENAERAQDTRSAGKTQRPQRRRPSPSLIRSGIAVAFGLRPDGGKR